MQDEDEYIDAEEILILDDEDEEDEEEGEAVCPECGFPLEDCECEGT